jgi:parvulin-like peptidyl-prolyl isomerase
MVISGMKRHKLLTGCLLIILVLTGCGQREPAAASAATNFQPVAEVVPAEAAAAEAAPLPVVAVVNGAPIYQNDFEKRVEQFQAAEVDSGFVETQSPERLEQIRRQVLDGLIDQVLIEQAAETKGIVIGDNLLEQKVTEMQAGQSLEQFESWLAINNFTEADFRQALRAQLIAAELFSQIIAQAPTAMDQVHARHILLKDPAEAQTVLARLEAGENFVDLAQQLSADETTKANGGDLGWFPRGIHYVPPEVETVAFSLEAGQISPIIESVLGYHLVRVDLREANRPLTPQQVQTLQNQVFYDWLAQERASAQIEQFLN